MGQIQDFHQNEDENWGPAFARAWREIETKGGGTLRVPPGEYNTGPWDLPGNLDLILEAGAMVTFIPEFELYPPTWTRWEGVDCFACHPLVFASSKNNITIRGEGTLDGSGETWWKAYRKIRAEGRRVPATELEVGLSELNRGFESHPSGGGGRELQFLRPPLLQFYECDQVRVEGICVQNSPFWNTHPLYSRNISFIRVLFRNPANAPNTDGLDIDSCENVTVKGCIFDVGDDCVAIKSGAGPGGISQGRGSKNILIEDCVMHAGHGGIVVGSETAGGVAGLKVVNCTMKDTDRGIRIKTRRGRGGVLEDLEFRDIHIDGCKSPIVINSFYRCGADPSDTKLFGLEPQGTNEETPIIRRVLIQNLQASGCRASAGFIAGLPEAPIEHLTIRESSIQLSPLEDSIDPSEAAMDTGLPKAKDRNLRVFFAQNWTRENLQIVGEDIG